MFEEGTRYHRPGFVVHSILPHIIKEKGKKRERRIEMTRSDWIRYRTNGQSDEKTWMNHAFKRIGKESLKSNTGRTVGLLLEKVTGLDKSLPNKTPSERGKKRTLRVNRSLASTWKTTLVLIKDSTESCLLCSDARLCAALFLFLFFYFRSSFARFQRRNLLRLRLCFDLLSGKLLIESGWE